MSEAGDSLNLQELTLSDAQESGANFTVSGPDEGSTMGDKLQAEVLKSIKVVGYNGPLTSEQEFGKALQEGPKSVEYTKLISNLTNELRVTCSIDECVNAIASPEDSVSFIMETSSFLKELGCPYAALTQGPVVERLGTISDRLLLIQHLLGEIMAARILRENRPEKKIELKLNETSQAADLRKICQTLGFPKPPANITMQTLMQKLTPTVQSTVQKAGQDLLGNPIFNGTLTAKQWETMANVQKELHNDYRIRREMLLKRLDCTIQSFQWSDKTKGKDEQFRKALSEKRKVLSAEPDVDLSDLLASRDDLAIIEKTSSASVRKNTKSSINKVIIGQVPDRGGRTSEQAPPPPEMPPWQQRQAGPSGRGGFQGQRGNYARGGGQSNYGGGQGNHGGGQGSYGGGQSNYGAAKGNYGGGQSNYSSQGGNSYSQANSRSFDSAGSYGDNKNSYSQAGDYSRGGSAYSNEGSNYSRGGSSYSRGGNDYTRGANDYSRDSRGDTDYSRDSRGGTDYSRDSRGGTDYSRDSRGGNDYSRGASDYSRSDNYSKSYSQGSYSARDSYTHSQGAFDSAGSYGGYQEPKRAKTYDDFQQNRTTYADQYVQESQHNQQYQSRDNRGQRGRSSYGRGGRGGYR